MFLTKTKRILITALVSVLCVALLVGSAFALSPLRETIYLNGGISLLSLNDGDDTRTVTTSGTTKMASGSTVTFPNVDHVDFSYDSGEYEWYSSVSLAGTSRTATWSVSSGYTVQIQSVVDYPYTDYDAVSVSGGGSFSLYTFLSAYDSATLLTKEVSSSKVYPSSVQLMVNGSMYGDKITCSSTGGFTLPDYTIELNGEDITSLGYSFTFPSSSVSINSGSALYKFTGGNIRFILVDNGFYVPVEKEDPYLPLINTIIGWLRSIFSNINTTNGLITGTNERLDHTNQDLDDIVYVYADEDDKQLKADTKDVVNSATDSFYGSDSSTSIKTDDVSDVKNVLDGTNSLFSSGYEITDVFEDIGGNDDYLLWFTSDTANALDSTGSASAVDDSDSFNHWRVNQQMEGIRNRIGGGSE